MIIVSQDKMAVHNFDKISKLQIRENYILIYNDMFYEKIGLYETEERAKEVLQEIIKRISMFNYFKCVNAEVQEVVIGSFIRNKYYVFDAYEMPEK